MKKSKKIEEMNIKDIIYIMGVPNILDDIRMTYKYDVFDEDVFVFEQLLKKCNYEKEKLFECFEKSELIFDKTLYVFHLARLLEVDKIRMAKYDFLNVTYNPLVYFIDSSNEKIEIGLNFAYKELNNADIIDIWLKKEDNKYSIEYDYSLRLIEKEDYINKRNKSNIEIFRKLDQKIGIKNIIKFLKPSDLTYICIYPNLGNLLSRYLYDNDYSKNLLVNYEDKVLGIKKNIDKNIENKIEVFSWSEFEFILRKYIIFIDIDKMLLLSASVFYNKYGSDFKRFSINEVNKLKMYITNIEEFFKKENPTIYVPTRFPIKISFKLIKKLIDDLKSKFINETYYTQKDIANLKCDFLSGNKKIDYLRPEDLKKHFNFNVSEYVLIIKNDINAYTYIYNNKIVDEYELDLIVTLQDKICKEQLYTMIENNLITVEKLKRYYLSNKVSFETLISVEEMLKKDNIFVDVTEIILREDVMDAYLFNFDLDKFDKIKEMYLYKIKNMSLEERTHEGFELLSSKKEKLNENDLIYFYQIDFITIENLKSALNFKKYNDLIARYLINQYDIKWLIDEKFITIEEICDILINNITIDDENKKNNLIYSYYLIQGINNKNELIIKLENKLNKLLNIDIFSLSILFKCFYKIDEENYIKIFDNGFINVFFPKKHIYIIAKVFDNEKNKLINDSVIYVIDEKVFEKNKKNIANHNNEIDEYALIYLNNDSFFQKNNLIVRICTLKDYYGVKTYFGIDDKNIYVEKDEYEIKMLLEKINNR